ncbi:MAG: hypothetical protein M9934_07165 [Thermomicrobiales bacterium]|nr:hypothetical protein [Thermomicrobiales bacterium]
MNKQNGEMRTEMGEMRTEMGEMRTEMGEMRTEIAEVRQLVDEVIDGTNQQTDIIIEHIDRTAAASNARFEDHESRISRLERHAA